MIAWDCLHKIPAANARVLEVDEQVDVLSNQLQSLRLWCYSWAQKRHWQGDVDFIEHHSRHWDA
jgi:hypothetical protein